MISHEQINKIHRLYLLESGRSAESRVTSTSDGTPWPTKLGRGRRQLVQGSVSRSMAWQSSNRFGRANQARGGSTPYLDPS